MRKFTQLALLLLVISSAPAALAGQANTASGSLNGASMTNPNSNWHFDFSIQQAMDNKSTTGYTNAYDMLNPSSNWQASVEWAKVMGDEAFFYAKVTGGTALPTGEYVMMAAVENGPNAGANGSIYMTTVVNDPNMLSNFAANPYLPSQQYQVLAGSMYMNDYSQTAGNGGGMGPRSNNGSDANGNMGTGYYDQTQGTGMGFN